MSQKLEWFRVYAAMRTWGGRLVWSKVRCAYETESDAMRFAQEWAERLNLDQMKIERVYDRS